MRATPSQASDVEPFANGRYGGSRSLSVRDAFGIDADLDVPAFSEANEYVPDHVEKDALLERLCNAMNEEVGLRSNVEERSVATPLIIPKANHNLSKEEGDGACFVNAVAEQLKIAVPSL